MPAKSIFVCNVNGLFVAVVALYLGRVKLKTFTTQSQRGDAAEISYGILL